MTSYRHGQIMACGICQIPVGLTMFGYTCPQCGRYDAEDLGGRICVSICATCGGYEGHTKQCAADPLASTPRGGEAHAAGVPASEDAA